MYIRKIIAKGNIKGLLNIEMERSIFEIVLCEIFWNKMNWSGIRDL